LSSIFADAQNTYIVSTAAVGENMPLIDVQGRRFSGEDVQNLDDNNHLNGLAFSPKSGKRSFLSLSSYYTIPIGDLRSANIDELGAGFAKNGYGFSLEGAYMFRPKIGIGGMLARYINDYKTDELSKELVRVAISDRKNELRIQTNATPHTTSIVMIGPNFSFPLRNITFDLKFFMGYVSFQYPKVESQIVASGNNMKIVT